MAPLTSWLFPDHAWQRVHIDLAELEGQSYLVLTDAFSKWPEVFEMKSTTTSKVLDLLRFIFACYGLPQQLVSDNGPQFTSAEFKEFCGRNGIQHVRVAPYHPASNGAAERLVQSFKASLKKSASWFRTVSLANFLLIYRSTPHTTTN